MMEQIIQITLLIISLLIVFDVCQQSKDVWGLLRHMRRERVLNHTSDSVSLPKSAVVLALRGPDPQLRDTLHALMSQDYPDFHVYVVVDSEHDPVLNDVISVQKDCGNDLISVSVLRNPSRCCSLKCSSLIQAVQELDPDINIVAFIDGDAIPHKTWLRELVLPLVNDEADVSGGNRWYLPSSAGLGSMARYFWNAAYLTGMHAQGTPWAGTMAFRRETIRRIGLLDAWSKAMSVDATLHRCMKLHGLRFKLVESLIMSNREEISLPEFHRWVTRQMAVIRYSASSTARMAEIQVGILLVLHSLLPLASVVAFAIGIPSLGLAAIGMLAGYWLFCSLRMILIEHSMRKSIGRRGEPTKWMTLRSLLLWYPSVPLVHYVIGFGVLQALRMQQVNWRGISYRLASNGVVSMVNYHPYGTKWIKTDNQSIV